MLINQLSQRARASTNLTLDTVEELQVAHSLYTLYALLFCAELCFFVSDTREIILPKNL